MRKAIKRLMAKAMPVYLVEQVTTEVRLATKRMFTARSVRRRVNLQKGCRVNIGCGGNPTLGWINLDVILHPDGDFWDSPLGLPFFDPPYPPLFSYSLF